MKQDLMAPTLVNLLTALLLFLFVVLFQEPIYDVLGLSGTKDFPLLCVVEPHDEAGTLAIDLLIVNRTADELSRQDLVDFLAAHASEDEVKMGPDIRLLSTKRIRFDTARPDTTFNGDKGSVSFRRAQDGKECVFTLDQIGPGGILRLIVRTDAREHWTRNAKGTLEANGVRVKYAGK